MSESPFYSYGSGSGSGSVVLYLEPMLNSYCENYKNILTLSAIPSGPLKDMVFLINVPKLSPFSNMVGYGHGGNCIYALARYTKKPTMGSEDSFMYADDIPAVLSYLESNGYVIETKLTSMLQKGGYCRGAYGYMHEYDSNRKMICMFTYSA